MLTSAAVKQRAIVWINGLRSRAARLRSNSFVRKVGILSGGSALGHAFTLAAAPFLTRIYGPRDFGALGLFSSFLNVVSVAVALRYEISIPSGKDEDEAAYLTLFSLILALPMGVLAAGLLWVLIHSSILGFGGLPWYTPLLLALAMGFVGIFTALRYWCLRRGRFDQISQGVVVQSAGRALFQTAIGAVGFHSAGLLCGEVLGRGFGMSRMFRTSWPHIQRCVRAFHWKDFSGALWRNRKFPLYSLPSGLLDSLAASLSVPLLIRLYGDTVGGHYSLVWKAITVPSVLLTVAIADTFHSHLANCAREEPHHVARLFKRTSLALLLLGGIPALILWFWGVPLFRVVFGSEWALSGAMAAIIAPWYLADFVYVPVSRVVLVLSGQEWKLILDAMGVASLLTVFFVVQWRGIAPMQTIKTLAVVSVGLRLFSFAILSRIVARFERTRAGKSPGCLIPVLD
jgi:O-antigen/teichoic acid export membrane protein